MAKEVKYRCDLCNVEIHALKAGQPQTGLGAIWRDNNKLTRSVAWIDAPIHLCFDCVRAVRDMSEELVTLNII